MTTLAGALAGAATAWFIVWPLVITHFSTASDTTLVAVGYPAAVLAVLTGTALALRMRFRTRTLSIEGVSVLVGLVAGALVGLPATLAISRALAYPTAPALVLVEAVPMLALSIGGIAVSRTIAAKRGMARGPA